MFLVELRFEDYLLAETNSWKLIHKVTTLNGIKALNICSTERKL